MLSSDSKFFKLAPWAHQLESINKCIERKFFALFYDMGAGKSSTIINIARYKYLQNKRILRTIIITPLAVCQQFTDEWEKFGGPKYDKTQVLAVVGGTKAAKLKKIKQHSGNIWVINHDSLNVADLWLAMWNFDPEIIIIDESHRFKNGTARKTKNLLSLIQGKRFEEKKVEVKGKMKIRRKCVEKRPSVPFRFILTGSPILNSPMDIWSQFQILDESIFPGNFTVFRGMFMTDKNDSWKGSQSYFPKWVPKDDCADKLNEIIYSHADRVLKKDCMDLPPFIRTRLEIELHPEEKKHYQQMRDEFVTFLDSNPDNAMIAELAITKALRLQQILCGIFVHDERDDKGRRVITKIKTNRIKVLKETLQDLITVEEGAVHGPKIIIWTVFQDTYDDIGNLCEDLKIPHVFITGRQSQKQKEESMRSFREDPETRIAICNQAAAGTGINLTSSSYSIYYSKNYNLEHDEQSEARNYRGGSEIHESVTRIDLVAPGTMDEIILESLEGKASMAATILKIRDRI